MLDVLLSILLKLGVIAAFWYHGFCVIRSLKLLTVSCICLCFTSQQAQHKLSKVRNVTGLHHTSLYSSTMGVRLANRVGTNIVQPVNSSGKCWKLPARQILQKSLRWQILAFMNKIKLKTS